MSNAIKRYLSGQSRAGVRAFMKSYESSRMNDYSGGLLMRVEDDGTITWRNHQWLVVRYSCPSPTVECRLTVNKRELKPNGDWMDGITWDDLQWTKNQCGFGNRTAIEVYPPDANVVNIANMRHLWILNEHLPFSL